MQFPCSAVDCDNALYRLARSNDDWPKVLRVLQINATPSPTQQLIYKALLAACDRVRATDSKRLASGKRVRSTPLDCSGGLK